MIIVQQKLPHKGRYLFFRLFGELKAAGLLSKYRVLHDGSYSRISVEKFSDPEESIQMDKMDHAIRKFVDNYVREDERRIPHHGIPYYGYRAEQYEQDQQDYLKYIENGQ